HFVEVKTFRMKGHAEHDDQHYVAKADLERWAKQDPIDRYRNQLLTNGWAEEQDLKDIYNDVRDEIDQATDACVNEPLPPPESALTGVYADPPAAERLWFRGMNG
ncbi:MAG TPA: thiamine pyrophosphate-dependent enzyme, partial [Gemmatimonadales bacterium]|nr:thiamine pyrophosphate-dependent enzyme [Gemmatimonadales bacterium]